MRFSKAAKFELTAQKEAVAERKRTAVISEAGPVEVVRTVIDPAEADPVMAVPVPGNPVAVFVTFVRVVRPLLLRLSGASPQPLAAVPARVTFSYKKKKDRREYIRVTAATGSDGVIELAKYPYEGAGLLASLTETSGLGEIAEDVTALKPGDMIGYLPYPLLTN